MNKDHFRTARSVANLKRGRNDWYRIENRSETETTVYIYDEIGFFGVTADDFVKDLNSLQTNKIKLRLNTPGGNVFDGISIYNALKDHDAEVEAIVDGLAASAGAFIFQAGDKRVMNRSTQLMIHNAEGVALGDADTMREMADLLDKNTENIANIFAERSDQSLETILSAMKSETWYNADEAVDFGLADEVNSDSKEVDNSFDLSIYNYAGRVNAPAPKIPEKQELDFDSITQALNRAFA